MKAAGHYWPVVSRWLQIGRVERPASKQELYSCVSPVRSPDWLQNAIFVQNVEW
jgi:hypothetical protein